MSVPHRQNSGAGGSDARGVRLEAKRYKAVFAERQRFHGRLLTMWVARGEQSECRAGVAAAKRVLHGAVERNRAKRLLREAFRQERALLAEDVDVILMPRQSIRGADCQAVAQDLRKLFKRAGVLRRTTCP